MKRIWTFTTVKDEEDIIESFVRYHMNIVDGMVISDNGSNDKTLDILYKLKKEGYNLDILVDDSQYFDQMTKRNDLLNYTIEKYHPDFLFPIDADEFICSYKKENPRKEILKLKKDVLYKYKMKNYVVSENDSNELFIPKKITMLRTSEEDIHHNFKCFITDEIYKQGIILEIGSHSASFKDKKEISIKESKTLYLAHYPVRSKYQLINKVIAGRLNNSSLHSREEGFGFHQYEILDEIVKLGTITEETLYKTSRNYSMFNKQQEVILKSSPIYTDFCKKIKLKYTKIGTDDKLLSNTIKTSMAIINHMREKNKNEMEKNYKIQEELNLEIQRLKSEIQAIINTKTWRYKEKILKILRLKRKK